MAKKVKTETTLITATDLSNNDAFSFYAIHNPDVDIREALKAAFQEWYETDEGQEFVEDNGTNWGDATYIDDEFLLKHGIHKYDALGSTNGKKWKVAVTEYDHRLTVDHNESLVEEN